MHLCYVKTTFYVAYADYEFVKMTHLGPRCCHLWNLHYALVLLRNTNSRSCQHQFPCTVITRIASSGQASTDASRYLICLLMWQTNHEQNGEQSPT